METAKTLREKLRVTKELRLLATFTLLFHVISCSSGKKVPKTETVYSIEHYTKEKEKTAIDAGLNEPQAHSTSEVSERIDYDKQARNLVIQAIDAISYLDFETCRDLFEKALSFSGKISNKTLGYIYLHYALVNLGTENFLKYINKAVCLDPNTTIEPILSEPSIENHLRSVKDNMTPEKCEVILNEQ